MEFSEHLPPLAEAAQSGNFPIEQGKLIDAGYDADGNPVQSYESEQSPYIPDSMAELPVPVSTIESFLLDAEAAVWLPPANADWRITESDDELPYNVYKHRSRDGAHELTATIYMPAINEISSTATDEDGQLLEDVVTEVADIAATGTADELFFALQATGPGYATTLAIRRGSGHLRIETTRPDNQRFGIREFGGGTPEVYQKLLGFALATLQDPSSAIPQWQINTRPNGFLRPEVAAQYGQYALSEQIEPLAVYPGDGPDELFTQLAAATRAI